MHHKTIGFIGGGRVTRIFLEGWTRAQKLPASITVSDPNAELLAKLKARFPSIATVADNAVTAAKDIVFLAVHPPVMGDAVGLCKSSLGAGSIVVSLAPKLTIVKLTGLLGGFARLARVIPNAPSVVGAGFNPMAFAPALSASDKAEITVLLSPLGECPEVPEEKLEAYAVLSAMGPTYLWFQLQTLREVAAGFGLSEAEIAPAMKRMACGATRTLLESGLPPAEVMDLIPVKPLADMEAQVRLTMSKSQTATIQNRQTMSERQALFLRFGYDSAASLKFILAKVLPLPGHVLEIGTGKGGFLAQLGKHAAHITTLDNDADQQRLAKRHVRQAGARCPIRYVIHDAERLPWADASFDSVASVNTFHHLKRPMRVFKEMLRVLKPGGKLVLCDFSPRGFQIFDRIHRFEGGTHPRLKDGLADFARLLCRRGWKTKRFKGCNQEILVATSPFVPTKEQKHT